MKPAPAIDHDKLMQREIPLGNLRRLAASLGIETAKWLGLSDERHRIARAIGKWYKGNPAPKRRRRGRPDRMDR